MALPSPFLSPHPLYIYVYRYHQYKFIVDGKWRHDETAPFMPDPLGNVNNWLFVRRIDSNSNAFDAQLQLQQLAHQQQMQMQQIPHSQPNLMMGGMAMMPASMMGPSPMLPPSQVLTAPLSPHLQHSISTQPLTSTLTSASARNMTPQDVDMTRADSMANVNSLALGGGVGVGGGGGGGVGSMGPSPIVIHNPKEPEYTRKKVGDFLSGHTCYELIPESGRVVVIDVDLPVG